MQRAVYYSIIVVLVLRICSTWRNTGGGEMAIFANIGLFFLISLLAILALVVALPVIVSAYGIACPWCRVCGGEPIKLRA